MAQRRALDQHRVGGIGTGFARTPDQIVEQCLRILRYRFRGRHGFLSRMAVLHI